MEYALSMNQMTMSSFKQGISHVKKNNKLQASKKPVSSLDKKQKAKDQNQLPMCRTVRPNNHDAHIMVGSLDHKAQAFATLILEVVCGHRPLQDAKAISTAPAYVKIGQLVSIMHGFRPVKKVRARGAQIKVINSQWLDHETVEVSVVGFIQNQYKPVAIRLEKKIYGSYHLNSPGTASWRATAVEVG